MRRPSDAAGSLNDLRHEHGWEPEALPTGRTSWRLGHDDRLPRLLAGLPPDDTDEQGVGYLTVMPPLVGDLTTYDPQPILKAWASHGWNVKLLPIGNAYSTCTSCDCPLPEVTDSQVCPNCRSVVHTLALPVQVKRLSAVCAKFSSETELVRAALEWSEPFRACLREYST